MVGDFKRGGTGGFCGLRVEPQGAQGPGALFFPLGFRPKKRPGGVRSVLRLFLLNDPPLGDGEARVAGG